MERRSRGATIAGWLGLTAWTLVVFGVVLSLGDSLFHDLPGCFDRSTGWFESRSGLAISGLVLVMALAFAWWALGGRTGRRRARRLLGGTILAIPLGLAIAVLGSTIQQGCMHGSGVTVINRTTTPIAVLDHDSSTIVAQCADRTITWQTTWGGPNREPIPAGAYRLVLDSLLVPADAMPSVTYVFTRDGRGRDGPGNPHDVACDGPVPPTALPSATPAPTRSG